MSQVLGTDVPPQQTLLSALKLCPRLFVPFALCRAEGLSCAFAPPLLLVIVAPAQGLVLSCQVRGPFVKGSQERESIKVNVVGAQRYYVQKDSCIYKNHNKLLRYFQQVNKRQSVSCSYLIKTVSCITGENMSHTKTCSFPSSLLTSGAWTWLRKVGWHLAAVLHLV